MLAGIQYIVVNLSPFHRASPVLLSFRHWLASFILGCVTPGFTIKSDALSVAVCSITFEWEKKIFRKELELLQIRFENPAGTLRDSEVTKPTRPGAGICLSAVEYGLVSLSIRQEMSSRPSAGWVSNQRYHRNES